MASDDLSSASITSKSALLWPLASLVAAMLSLQVGATIAKGLFPVIGAEGATALRLFFSALMLTAFFRPWRARLNARNWRPVVIYGCSVAGMNLLFYLALKTIPLGVAIALEFSGPMAVAMLWSRRPIDFVWIALAIAGLFLLLPLGQAEEGLDPYGIAFALGAGSFWAIYIVMGQKAGRDHGELAPVLGTIIAAAITLPIGLFKVGPAIFAPAVLPAAVSVAILSSALAYTLEMFALRRLPTHSFGTLMSFEPALGSMIGFMLLGEVLSTSQMAAIGIVVLASAGTTLTIKPKAQLHLPD